MAILLNGWIFPTGGVAPGRVCTCSLRSLRSRLVIVNVGKSIESNRKVSLLADIFFIFLQFLLLKVFLYDEHLNQIYFPPGCPTQGGKSCIFPFKTRGKVFAASWCRVSMPIVADGKSVNFCQPYNGKYFCGTSIKSDGHYSAWDYCDSTKCPLTGKSMHQCSMG